MSGITSRAIINVLAMLSPLVYQPNSLAVIVPAGATLENDRFTANDPDVGVVVYSMVLL